MRSGPLVVCLLAVLPLATASAHSAGSASCRELERQVDLIKGDATSTQLNLALFAAADLGCVPLALRLLEAGASLEARDRLDLQAGR
jgi:hypothetical protein